MNKISEKEKNLLLDYKECLKKEMFNSLNTQFDLCHKDYRYHRMIASIIDTIYHIDKMIRKSDEAYSDDEDMTFTPEMAHEWVNSMHNEDGTTGAHWTIEETTAVAEKIGVKFEHITEYCFWSVMSMYYSDALNELKEYHKLLNIAAPNANQIAMWCGLMAKSFLFDKDAKSPKEKVSKYYNLVFKE